MKIRIKIRTKIGIVFLVFFFEILTFMFLLSTAVRQYKHYTHDVREETEELELIDDLGMALAQAIMPVNDFLIAGGDPNEPENFNVLGKKFEGLFDTMARFEFGLPEEREIFSRMKEDWLKIKKIARQIFSIPNPIGDPEAGRLMEEMDKISDRAIEDSDRFGQFAHQEIDFYETKAKKTEKQISIIILAGTLIGILFIVGGLFFFSRTVSSPIVLLKNAAVKVGAGVLEKTANIKSNDEIGELSASFNQMVENIEKTQRELLLSKDYVDGIISSMIDILIVVNPDGAIRTVNKATCDLLGYKEEELISKPVGMIIAAAAAAGLSFTHTGLKELVEKGSARDLELDLIAKNGEKIPVMFSGSVLYETRMDADKKDAIRNTHDARRIIGIVGVARDMRPILNLLRELRDSKEKIESYSESLEGLVEDKTKELKEKIIDLEEARRVMISILEDTDEARKNLEKTLADLKSTQAQLIQAGKLAGIGQIAAGVAHEINNPLTSIMGFAQLTMSKKDLDAEIRQDLSVIEKEAKRCVTIIENLLSFARPQELQKMKVNINNVVEATIKVIEYSVVREKIEIVKKYAENLPSLLCDPQQLQQVFMNIILNAAHAMPRGGNLTISTGVSERNFIEISFRDTGIGIPDDIKDKIFEPFFTTSYKAGYRGTGLGLSISDSIVKAHGGRIDVESAAGKGSIFKVALPVNK